MIFRKIYYWVFIVLLSLRRTLFAYNLGEKVNIDNSICTLTQGVDKPFWNAVVNNTTYYHGVHEKNFKKIWTYDNLSNVFRSAYKFYMSNWYDIWVRNGIEDWCKNCNIW